MQINSWVEPERPDDQVTLNIDGYVLIIARWMFEQGIAEGIFTRDQLQL